MQVVREIRGCLREHEGSEADVTETIGLAAVIWLTVIAFASFPYANPDMCDPPFRLRRWTLWRFLMLPFILAGEILNRSADAEMRELEEDLARQRQSAAHKWRIHAK
jgi:hypothetical protein